MLLRLGNEEEREAVLRALEPLMEAFIDVAERNAKDSEDLLTPAEVRDLPYDQAQEYMREQHEPIASRSVDSERWERRHMRLVKDVYGGEGVA
jgi:hypothetical protein